MSTLIRNKCLLYFIYSVLFILSIPLISIIVEIVFRLGQILGTFVRSYGC
jgi:hypothetical protein